MYPRIAPRIASVATAYGAQLTILPRHDYVQREIYLQGHNSVYEQHVVKWIISNIGPAMTVVDIGAHIGYYATLLCGLIGPQGMAAYVEPSPEHFALLNQNLERNGYHWAHAVAAVVSDVSGRITFHTRSDSGRNSLGFSKDTTSHPLEVTSYTLDELLDRCAMESVDLLQIDTEGAESLIVQGARSSFEHGRIRLILCEYHPTQMLHEFGVNPASFIQFMRDAGFSITSLDPFTANEIDFTHYHVDMYQHLVFRQEARR